MDRQQKIELLKNIASGKIRLTALTKQPINFRFQRIEETENYRDTLSGTEMSLTEINALDICTIEPLRITRINMMDGTGNPFEITINTDGNFLRRRLTLRSHSGIDEGFN